MKAYKGFNPDMTCNGFQYEEGKTYEEEKAELCQCGFHACEAPLYVFRYYPPCNNNGELNKFHEVELEEVSDERGEDTKVCAKKIKIGAELNFFGLAKAHVEYVKEHLTDNNQANTGFHSAATNTGNYSAATNTGVQSAATNTGDRSAATNTGNYSAATNTGDQSVAVAWGIESKAKAALGSYIVLAEWVEDKYGNYVFKRAKMAKVDGLKIKADTFYILKGGKFVEATE